MEYTTAQRICFIVEHTAPSEWPNEAMFALKLVAKLYSWAVKMVRNPSVCKLNLNGAVVWKQESCIQRGSFIDQRSLQGMWSSFVLRECALRLQLLCSRNHGFTGVHHYTPPAHRTPIQIQCTYVILLRQSQSSQDAS